MKVKKKKYIEILTLFWGSYKKPFRAKFLNESIIF